MGNKLTYPTVDLSGKVAIVTGGNTGIGYETAKALAEMGAHTFIACRSRERAAAAIDRMKQEVAIGEGNELKVEYLLVDLASFSSVKDFVKTFREKNLPLHILVNNAAICGVPFKRTEDNIESQVQVNHLSPLLLTLSLLPSLKEAATNKDEDTKPRVVFVTCSQHTEGVWSVETFNTDEENYQRLETYKNTKLYNVMTSSALHRRLRDVPITISCAEPGNTKTELSRGYADLTLPSLVNTIGTTFGNTPKEGAATIINCAVNPELNNSQTVVLYAESKPKPPSPASQIVKFQEDLWKSTFEKLKQNLPKEMVEKYGPAQDLEELGQPLHSEDAGSDRQRDEPPPHQNQESLTINERVVDRAYSNDNHSEEQLLDESGDSSQACVSKTEQQQTGISDEHGAQEAQLKAADLEQGQVGVEIQQIEGRKDQNGVQPFESHKEKVMPQQYEDVATESRDTLCQKEASLSVSESHKESIVETAEIEHEETQSDAQQKQEEEETVPGDKWQVKTDTAMEAQQERMQMVAQFVERPTEAELLTQADVDVQFKGGAWPNETKQHKVYYGELEKTDESTPRQEDIPSVEKFQDGVKLKEVDSTVPELVLTQVDDNLQQKELQTESCGQEETQVVDLQHKEEDEQQGDAHSPTGELTKEGVQLEEQNGKSELQQENTQQNEPQEEKEESAGGQEEINKDDELKQLLKNRETGEQTNSQLQEQQEEVLTEDLVHPELVETQANRTDEDTKLDDTKEEVITEMELGEEQMEVNEKETEGDELTQEMTKDSELMKIVLVCGQSESPQDGLQLDEALLLRREVNLEEQETDLDETQPGSHDHDLQQDMTQANEGGKAETGREELGMEEERLTDETRPQNIIHTADDLPQNLMTQPDNVLPGETQLALKQEVAETETVEEEEETKKDEQVQEIEETQLVKQEEFEAEEQPQETVPLDEKEQKEKQVVELQLEETHMEELKVRESPMNEGGNLLPNVDIQMSGSQHGNEEQESNPKEFEWEETKQQNQTSEGDKAKPVESDQEEEKEKEKEVDQNLNEQKHAEEWPSVEGDKVESEEVEPKYTAMEGQKEMQSEGINTKEALLT